MSISAIDKLCLGGSLISSSPVTVTCGSDKFTGTAGARDSARELMEGGIINDDMFRLLVPIENFYGITIPAVGDVFDVTVTTEGIPCAEDDENASGTTQPMRVKRKGRAGAGITFDLVTKMR